MSFKERLVQWLSRGFDRDGLDRACYGYGMIYRKVRRSVKRIICAGSDGRVYGRAV